MRTILPRCRSPWQRRTSPARSRAASSGRTRSNAPRVASVSALTACGGNSSGEARSSASFWAITSVSSSTKPAVLLAGATAWAPLDGASERVGERGVDSFRLGQMIERLRLIEAPHLHRPFHRLTRAADGEGAVRRCA